MKFQQKLNEIIKKNNSLLCIGLDPNLDKFSKDLLKSNDPIFEFNKKIIDKTYDLVCAYKPDIAFYEAYGINGLESLKKTLEYIPKDTPVILDAKRGSVGHTARLYAKSIFEYWNADAVTLNIFTGKDGVNPFLKYKNRPGRYQNFKFLILNFKLIIAPSSSLQNRQRSPRRRPYN